MYQNTQQTWACYPPTEIAHFGHSALKDMFGGVSLHVWPNIKPLTKQTKDCHVCSNNVKIYIACVCPCFTSILLSWWLSGIPNRLNPSYQTMWISIGGISCHFMPFHAISCHFMPFHAISCHFMPFHAISCHFMPFHATWWLIPLCTL